MVQSDYPGLFAHPLDVLRPPSGWVASRRLTKLSHSICVTPSHNLWF